MPPSGNLNGVITEPLPVHSQIKWLQSCKHSYKYRQPKTMIETNLS